MLLVTLTPGISALLLAMALGILVGSLRILPAAAKPGVSWSSKRLLRVGIVLLGLQISLPSLISLGASGVAVLLLAVGATFIGTLLIGRALRVERVTRYLIATGFSICGASAVAAMSSVVDPDQEAEEDVAQAIALVTLYGTVCMFVLPAISVMLGLSDTQAGLWIGSSVHEVAQVVAAGGAVSVAALAVATIAKLGRVVILAPLVAIVGVREARKRARDMTATPTGARPPILPLFVAGFLVMILVRTFIPLPGVVLESASLLATLLLTTAMFGLGTGVDLRRLLTTGGRPLVLGALSTLIAVLVPLAAILLLAPAIDSALA